MNFGDYRLLAQVDAGFDGPSYRAEDPKTGKRVEIRSLEGAQRDSQRWTQMLPRLRMLAIVDHPGIVELLRLEPKLEPPFVVLEWLESPNLAHALSHRGPLEPLETLVLVRDVADALTASHRLGLSHGRLGPSTIFGGIDRQPIKIDLTGIDCRAEKVIQAQETTDAPFRAPEAHLARNRNVRVSPKADLYSLGLLLNWLLTGRPDAQPSMLAETTVDRLPKTLENVTVPDTVPPLEGLLRELLQADPEERPSAREVVERLDHYLAEAGAQAPAKAEDFRSSPTLDTSGSGESSAASKSQSDHTSRVAVGNRLGRFQLVELLGQGGMGTVYRAEDLADGSVVALKVLKPDLTARPHSLRRFLKEARLLSEIQNPHITNFIEVNEDSGVHYLALEYVRGESLGARLARVGRLAEPLALAIMADVARALSVAHALGIVHRDIKPDNILLIAHAIEVNNETDSASAETIDQTFSDGLLPRIKLSDFGIARHVVETESLALTQDHAVIGTPAYMAPEQGSGGAIDPRTDVYAMGSTLFHLLAGRPPFAAGNLMELIAKHRDESPPSLRQLVTGISEGARQVVEKAMSKAPADRYPDASAMLDDLQRVLRGEPTSISAHPRLPESDPSRVLQFDFRWELDSPPRALWPLVTNTERLNRAVGLPSVRFQDLREPGQRPRREAETRMGGMAAAWEEHPFEWVEPRRFGVLRSYHRGPFRWVVSLVELTPRPGGGTTLTHRVRLETASKLLRPVVRMQISGGMKRSLERVYRRIDAALSGKLESGLAIDPFEAPHQLSHSRRHRLEAGLDRLIAAGTDPVVTEALGEFLALAPPQEVARIRPLALARRLNLDPEKTARVCLQAAREGLLVLLWDLLCPVCRIPSEVKETLKALKDHGHCEACDLDFELDFSNSIELIFRVHPEIRDAETATYCVGGPAHSPHVVAQVRVAPGERVELELELSEGLYALRGPQLPFQADFRVEPNALARRLDFELAKAPESGRLPSLCPGAQVLCLENSHEEELVARIERMVPRDDALTAARASRLPLFRELFPEEVLAPGQLASVRNLTFLVTNLEGAESLYDRWGDARAFAWIHGQLIAQDQQIREFGGVVVKTIGEGILATFDDPAAALEAAITLLSQPQDAPGAELANLRNDDSMSKPLEEPQKIVLVRAAIHKGAAMVATLNDQLDYFGAAVNLVLNMPRFIEGGELALSAPVAADPRVAAFFPHLGIEPKILPVSFPGGFIHSIRPPRINESTIQFLQEPKDAV